MNACLRSLLLASASAACAEAPPVEQWQVRAELQIVRLDAKRAVPLIARFTVDAPGAGEELRRLLANGSATLAAHLIGRASSGQRGFDEQTREIPYNDQMSTFHPGVIPRKKAGKVTASAHCPNLLLSIRKTGHTLEFEPYVHPGGSVASVNLVLRTVDFSGMQRFEGGVQNDGLRLCWDQPVFHSRHTVTNVVVRLGTPFLLGCCKLEGEPRICELHVLTAHARLLDGPSPLRSGKYQPTRDGFQEPAPTLPLDQTRIELHRFILAESEAIRLRPALLDSTRCESAFADLLAGGKSGRVELAGIFSAPLSDGNYGVFANVREQKYASELPPSRMPMPQWPVFECPPQCLIVRHVGDRLELDATKDNIPQHIDLSLDFQTDHHNGFMRWPTGPNEFADTAQTYSYQPDFLARKSKATVSLIHVKRLLLRFSKLPAPDARVEIVLIRPIIEHITNEPTPR